MKTEATVVVTPKRFEEICKLAEIYTFSENEQPIPADIQWKRTLWRNGVLYVESEE